MMPKRKKYRDVRWGVERLPPSFALPRHPHREAYANLVLDGNFIEASFAGRFSVGPGEVLLHGAFDCHANYGASLRGVTILRLPWSAVGAEGRFRVANPDDIVRLCERDPHLAAERLALALSPVPTDSEDWPALLARDIAADGSLSLAQWAEIHDVAPETVSRGFQRAFGVTPRLFRLETRTRRAWKSIVSSPSSLTRIAHDFHFADLAHLSRSVSALTGAPPSAWKGAPRQEKKLREAPRRH